MRKKLLSMVLALVMVVALGSAVAFAAEGGTETSVENYSKLKEALEKSDEPYTKITLTGNIEVEDALSITHDVTIVGDGTHTVKHCTSHTGTMFAISNNAKVTFENVHIDAGGGQWTWEGAETSKEQAIQKSFELADADSKEAIDSSKLISGTPTVTASDYLIKLSGGNCTLTLDGGTVITGYYKTSGGNLINPGGENNVINFNKCEIKHNLAQSSILAAGMGNNTHYNFNSGAVITDNFVYGTGNGGLIYLQVGSQIVMNEGAQITNNLANGSNGCIFQIYGHCDFGGAKQYSKFTMKGGTISGNTALYHDGNGWGSMIYIHSEGEFEMTGGSIINNTGARVGAISERAQNDARKMVLEGGTISGNRHSPNSGCGDMYFTTEADIGPNMTVEGDVSVDAHGHLTNNGTIKGNVTVYSSNDGQGYTTFVNNGTVEGELNIQNGAKVTNSKTIKGNVNIDNDLVSPYDETPGAFGNSNFENTGEITGDMNLCPGSTVTNSGTVDGNVTVQNDADLLLDGGGTVKKDVTVYPGGQVRTTDPSRQGTINGTLTFEYGGNPDTEDEPNEDHQRMEDIFEDSNIAAGSVTYSHHIHTQKAGSEKSETGDCTTPAGTTYVCATCGGTYYVGYEGKEPPEAKGHTWGPASDGVKLEATAEADGYTKEECSECGLVRYEIIPATGHKVVPPIESTGSATITCDDGHELSISYEGEHTGENHEWAKFRLIEGQCSGASGGTPDKMLFVCSTEGCPASCTVSFQDQTHNYEFAPIDNDSKIANCASGLASTKPADRCYKLAVVCTHCGNVIGGTEVEMKDSNAAPAYEHVWYIDRTVRPTKSICTDEVYYTYKCAICEETKTDIGEAAGSHQWELDEISGLFVCNARIGSDLHRCGQVQNGFNVSYQPRGGDTGEAAAPGFIEAQRKNHLPGEVVDLWFPATNWVKETAVGQSVFVGWSTVDFGAEPLTSEPVIPDGQKLYKASGTEKTVTIPANGGDVVLYAVWAMDLNRNGKPDYDATSESIYTITYDVNGGPADKKPADLTGLLVGASYPLADGSALTKTDSGDALVFAGWTHDATMAALVVPVDGVTLEENKDTLGTVIKTTLKWNDSGSGEKTVEIVHSPYKVNAADDSNNDKTITLYAVYAKTSSDDETKPGFEANYYHVEYYANDGTAKDGYTVDGNGLFYTCNDYHQNGSSVTGNDFLSVSQANLMIQKTGAVLVGWSATQHAELITDQGTLDSLNLMANNMPLTFNSANVKVYALWAQDRNNNNVGDYLEYHYNFTYHANEYLSNRTSSGSLVPTLSEPLTVNGTVPADNSGGILYACGADGLPTARAESYSFVLNGEYVELAIDSKLTADGNGHHYVQVGWSGFCHQAATSSAEARNWLIYEEGNSTSNDINGISYDGKFYRHIQSELYTDAYVVWAIDDNQNGVPDYADYVAATPSTTVDNPVTDADSGETSVAVNTGSTTSGTTAKATVSNSNMNKAVNSAVTEAAKQGTAPVVEVAVETSSRADSLNVTLPTPALEKLAEAEDASLVIISDIAEVALDNTALTALTEQATGNTVVLEVAPVDDSELSEAQAEAVGEAPVMDLSMVSNGVVIHDYDGGRITVTLPYKLAQGQSANDVVAYYLNDYGTLTPCTTSYDSKTEKVTFVTVHLSKYVIGDAALGEEKDCPSEKYADVDRSAWYHEGVDYVIRNKLMVGISDTTFSPDGKTTRAEMVQILYRLDGEPEVTESVKFDDVAAGQWYSDAVSWAAANKIVDGYGNGRFGPSDTITRDQMAAILYRYASYKGYDLTKTDDLTGYTDAASVSSWAETAMKWTVAEGIIEGTSTTTLSPSGDSTRAQVATIFMRFCEGVVK